VITVRPVITVRWAIAVAVRGCLTLGCSVLGCLATGCLATGCGEPSGAVDVGAADVIEAPRAHDAGRPEAGALDAVALDAGALDPERCARCHASQAAAWRGSLHAISDTDPIYLAEHAGSARDGEPDPWCATCHAPEGAPIGCATCHVRDGQVISAHASGRAPHPTRVDLTRSDERACAGCHDFDFPHDPGVAMQDTVDEWRHSAPAARGQTCADCHDPHAAPGRRDPVLAAGALDVRAHASRSGDGARLVLTLRSRAGHAVPTGDLFRRLVVRARTGGIEREAILARRFARRAGRRVELADDRVPARGARTVVLRFPRAGARIAWTIELEALPAERARALALAESTWLTRLADGSTELPRETERPREHPLVRR